MHAVSFAGKRQDSPRVNCPVLLGIFPSSGTTKHLGAGGGEMKKMDRAMVGPNGWNWSVLGRGWCLDPQPLRRFGEANLIFPFNLQLKGPVQRVLNEFQLAPKDNHVCIL